MTDISKFNISTNIGRALDQKAKNDAKTEQQANAAGNSNNADALDADHVMNWMNQSSALNKTTAIKIPKELPFDDALEERLNAIADFACDEFGEFKSMDARFALVLGAEQTLSANADASKKVPPPNSQMGII